MINMEQVDKDKMPAELIEFINKLSIKHATIPYQIVAKTGVETRRGEGLISFYDPRFPDADTIGNVGWIRGDRSPREYAVYSRKIVNARHRWDKIEQHSFRSKDLNKSVKTALEFIVPWDMSEFARRTADTALRKHSMWVDEHSQSQYELRMPSDTVVEELEHLLNLGVEFKTPEFKRAVEKVSEYKEWKRRRNTDPNLRCVLFKGDVVAITHLKGHAVADAQEVSGIDALPERIKNNVSLLKMMDNDVLVPNVGFRADANTYWVYAEDVL